MVLRTLDNFFWRFAFQQRTLRHFSNDYFPIYQRFGGFSPPRKCPQRIVFMLPLCQNALVSFGLANITLLSGVGAFYILAKFQKARGLYISGEFYTWEGFDVWEGGLGFWICRQRGRHFLFY